MRHSASMSWFILNRYEYGLDFQYKYSQISYLIIFVNKWRTASPLISSVGNDDRQITFCVVFWNMSVHKIIPPASKKLKGGYTCIIVPRCQPVRPPVDRIVYALYLPQYLADPFYIYTSCQATPKGVSHVFFLFFSRFQNSWHFFFFFFDNF